ncbi:cation:proton antiporter [Pseudoalteromonas tunicata]|uniref:cation:proton antiporter n=1 Tax=Pseudoalteromonas tunicata TaxID=314281 RepID=UPI00273E85EC|nr:cation:proton antiporter [Pseudoalteromonas tunicata]MDP5214442.1 cation:proton antiporter [Pseudoalteromonas tunicata]
MEYQVLFFVACSAFIYSVAVRQFAHAEITGPMFFVFVGLAIHYFVFETSVDLSNVQPIFQIFVELTLASVIFIDASNSNLKTLRTNWLIPTLLLLVALPLTFLLAAVIAQFIFPSLPIMYAALIAIIVTPTDAALCKGFIVNKFVPEKLREGINFESGLNDGLCVPIFLLIMLMINQPQESKNIGLVLHLFLLQIGIAVSLATVSMFITLKIISYCEQRHLFAKTTSPFLMTSLAICIYALTQYFGGSGFIAAFVAGLFFDWFYKGNVKQKLLSDSEQLSDFMSSLIWCVFGFLAGILLFTHFNFKIIFFSVLALTLVRMLPVFIVLNVTALSIKDRIILAWFGPRGMASIVFTLMVYQSDIPYKNEIVEVSFSVILLSVLLHGISTRPLINLFKKA